MRLPVMGSLRKTFRHFGGKILQMNVEWQAEADQAEKKRYFTTMKGYSRFVAGLLLGDKTRE